MQTEMQTELNEDIVQEMAEQFMAEAAAAGLAYQLDWDRAVREARAALAEKANEKADAAVKSVEKRRLWNEYKARKQCRCSRQATRIPFTDCRN